MRDSKSRDIFYGVVAIATLIIAVIGATLAYFSITAKSDENAVNAKSGTVSISYDDGQQVTASADELIPSSFEVVQKAYEKNMSNFGTDPAMAKNVCIDDNGYQVCSIYRFSISSDTEHQISATLNNDQNGFKTALSYALYKVTDDNKYSDINWQTLDTIQNSKFLNLKYCSNEDGDSNNYCFTGSLAENNKVYTDKASSSIFGYDDGGEIKNKTLLANTPETYDLVIFLNETNDSQNVDQGKEYGGTIIVSVVDSGSSGGHITGHMD